MLLVGLAGLCAIGCDSMSFTPPRPPELSTPPSTVRLNVEDAAARGLKSIDIILAPRGIEDIEYLRTASRVQAGLDRVRARIVEIPGAGPEASAWSERARAVGESTAEEPLAILVEAPASPIPELSKAVAEARARGVPIVALGRSLEDGSKEDEKEKEGAESESASTAREIVVTPEPFRLSAEILVERAIRNAKTGKLDPKDGALLFVNSTSDPLAGDRAEALREALKNEGVEAVEELRFNGPDDDGQKKLIERLEAHPKTAIVFATDFVSLNIADKTTEILKGGHPYVIAGYSADENHARNQTLTGQYAAVGVYSADRLIRKGINAAAAVQRGESVPDHVDVRVSMLESDPRAGLPKAADEDEPAQPRRAESESAKTKAESKSNDELKD